MSDRDLERDRANAEVARGATGGNDEEEIQILSIEGQSEGEREQEASGTEAHAGEPPPERAVEPREGPTGEYPAAEAMRLRELEERYLRVLADFDNYRKRSQREIEEAARRGLVDGLRELLPVLDNLERALAAAVEGSSSDELVRGVQLIVRQLADALRRLGVTPVAGVGNRFDPEVHEAVVQEESNGVLEPTVVAEFQRGYRLGDRLLRPALVKVATPGSSKREACPAEEVPEAPGGRGGATATPEDA